jgi:hypothetical protein
LLATLRETEVKLVLTADFFSARERSNSDGMGDEFADIFLTVQPSDDKLVIFEEQAIFNPRLVIGA